jgi:hypothetical protein
MISAGWYGDAIAGSGNEQSGRMHKLGIVQPETKKPD